MTTEPRTPVARHPRLAGQLPHAYPFRLLDGAFMLEPSRWVVGLKNITRDDPLVDGTGTFAPVLLAEAMAQAAGLALSAASGASAPAMLAQVDRFRCSPRIEAGDQMLVTVRLLRRFGTMAKVRTSVHIAGRRRAAAELVLHFPKTARRES